METNSLNDWARPWAEAGEPECPPHQWVATDSVAAGNLECAKCGAITPCEYCAGKGDCVECDPETEWK